MNPENMAYLYALGSVLTFASAAIVYTHFSLKISALWMTFFKCFVSVVCCIFTLVCLEQPLFLSFAKAWPFYFSGIIGLAIGDFFLLSAYRRMGAGRTLILFGFEPFIVGGFSYLFWGETLLPIQLVAILFFVFCLFLFSYEKLKESGKWEIWGLVYAFLGVALDAVGVLLSRYGFDSDPMISNLQGHFLRSSSALVALVLGCIYFKQSMFGPLKKMSLKAKSSVIGGSFLGTFLSIALYLQAIKTGKIATVTSIILTDSMVSTFLECLWWKRLPSRYMWFAILSFLCAMFCLFYPQLS